MLTIKNATTTSNTQNAVRYSNKIILKDKFSNSNKHVKVISKTKYSENKSTPHKPTNVTEAIVAFNNEMNNFITALSKIGNVDKRWLAISKTDIEKGIMCLERSIN